MKLVAWVSERYPSPGQRILANEDVEMMGSRLAMLKGQPVQWKGHIPVSSREGAGAGIGHQQIWYYYYQ